MAPLLANAVGADEAAARQIEVGRGVEGGQRPHVGALGHEPVGHRHDEAVQPRGCSRLEVGGGVSRVGRNTANDRTGSAQPAIELQREEQVGELRLAVGAPAVVAAFALEVVELHAPDAVRSAAERHHPRGVAPLHRVNEQAGQREVTQVVGPELKLEAVGGGGARRRHHPGVVDQEVQPLVLSPESLRKRSHRVQASEV